MMEAGGEFDLLYEPWIPVATRDGTARELGLLATLEQAPDLARITEASPVAAFGIHRLLTAVLTWYHPPRDRRTWMTVWQAGRFSDALLEAVRLGCGGRMRLFDPERPFYQSGDIPLTGRPAEPLKSVGYLAPEAATGTNVTHFDHGGENRHAFCARCCAKGLTALPCFAMAGGAGIKPGINGVPPIYLLPLGETLFQTLLYNWLQRPHRPEIANDDDPGPLWEGDGMVAARQERPRTGFVESLTWPPRRVRLFPGPGGACSRCGQEAPVRVSRMVFAQGWSRDKALPPWQDAWAAYRAPRNGDAMALRLPIRPSEGRDLWREFPGLFLEPEGDGSTRPTVLNQVADVAEDAREVTHEVYALRTDMKAKVFEWRRDSFRFPTALLRAAEAPGAIREALKVAEGGETALRAALRKLHPDGKLPTTDPLAYSTLRSYWQGLEPRFRTALLDPRLTGPQQERVSWAVGWSRQVEQQAAGELDRALAAFDPHGADWRRQVEARDELWRTLRRLVPRAATAETRTEVSN